MELNVTLRVARHPARHGKAVSEFRLALEERMTVLDALLLAQRERDGSIGFRYSCRVGMCGSCAVLVNRIPRLACSTLVKNLNSEAVTVEPLPHYPIIRDAVVSLAPFFEQWRRARPCPPVIVGVGLGGTADVAMSLAKEASTFRRIGTRNPDSDVAKLEQELLGLINETGIGPQGLGGATTAMAVNIEWAHTHISQNPVAVNIQCWRGERAEVVLDGDGKITWI